MEQPTGFDVPNVTAWLRERLDGSPRRCAGPP